jgi:hypothetical protein
MPQRITRTRSYSRRTLFGGRVTTSVSTSHTSRLPYEPVQVRLTCAQLLEMQRLQAEQLAAAREQDIAQQTAHMDAIVNAPRGFSPLSIARWLHTVPGAISTLVAFALSLIIVLTIGWPVAIIGLTVALAVVDWHNLRTMHGAIGWRQWFVSRRGMAIFVAVLLVLYGWLFLPVVYGIQAWTRASEMTTRARAIQQQRIAELEADVFSDRYQPPPPPPPVVPLA